MGSLRTGLAQEGVVVSEISGWDNLRFNALHVAPYFLRGIFLRLRLPDSIFGRLP